jgi:pilus assembly protein FimV
VRAAPPPAPVRAAPPPPVEEADIDGELEEIDFFVSQGLFDEALPILNELATRHPGDPRVQKLLAEIGEGAAEPAGSDKPTAPPPARVFDFDALAGDLDLEDITDDDVNNEIDKVFSQFKAGVEKQVSRSDYATHYDLGVAYREMGLHEDAIAEFRIAAGDPKREATAMTMIGACQSLLGRSDEALETFRCELEKKDLEESARLALMYEIAKVYEVQGRRDEALATYNAILQEDPGFADVVDRIDAMGL